MQGRSRSDLVARLLAQSWRSSPPQVQLTGEELEAIAATLLESGAGALAWRQVRGTSLEQCPSAFELHQSLRLNCLHVTRAIKETVDVYSLFRRNSIEPILVKGVSLVDIYPEPGLRPAGDIDLCVAASDYRRADTLLKSEVGRQYFVDLHKGFSNLDHHSFTEVYKRSTILKLDGGDIRVPSAEDHLRILCFHFLREGAWRPLWLCDIAALLESRPAAFDWDLFIGRNPRRAKWFACVIILAHQLLGARLEDVPDAIRAITLPHWFIAAVLKAWYVRAMQRRHLTPTASVWRFPMNTLKGMRNHWPNAIEGTVGVRGPFNNFPRLPLQIGHCVVRTGNYLRAALSTDR